MRPYAAALSLGSNIPPETLRLRRAVAALRGIVRIVKISSIWESSPVGHGSGERAFQNIALSLVTDLAPRELLRVIKQIENDHGRRGSRRNAPRPIDIDIIWGDVRSRGRDPELPHPRFRSRNFVLEPLREIRFDRLDLLTHRWIGRLEGAGDVRRVGPL